MIEDAHRRRPGARRQGPARPQHLAQRGRLAPEHAIGIGHDRRRGTVIGFQLEDAAVPGKAPSPSRYCRDRRRGNRRWPGRRRRPGRGPACPRAPGGPVRADPGRCPGIHPPAPGGCGPGYPRGLRDAPGGDVSPRRPCRRRRRFPKPEDGCGKGRGAHPRRKPPAGQASAGSADPRKDARCGAPAPRGRPPGRDRAGCDPARPIGRPVPAATGSGRTPGAPSWPSRRPGSGSGRRRKHGRWRRPARRPRRRQAAEPVQEGGHADAHLLGGLLGEGQGEDGLAAAVQYRLPGHAPGEHRGLSRPGAGEHQNGSLAVMVEEHGLGLLRIQSLRMPSGIGNTGYGSGVRGRPGRLAFA